ncbi:MAG: hypothetical protein GXP54_09285 [Deltaproteobacteria bacterium]|nr:hypothetical protein [Deltaproteobacteria bacterium]
MDASNEESFWKKIFQKKGFKPTGRATQFERAVRSETAPKRPAPAYRKARESTGIFIAEAVKDKRFETAAFTLVSKGKSLDAEHVGDKALQEGKFGQAIQIFEKIGNHRKVGLANEIAARDCLEKGGSKKLAAGRMYAAVQSYGKLLADKNEDRVLTMKKMALICDDLADLLTGNNDYFGAAETYLYGAQLYRYLTPLAHVHEHFTADPDFFARVEEKLLEDAGHAKDAFRRHVEQNNVDPKSDMGRKIIEKLKKIEELIKYASKSG